MWRRSANQGSLAVRDGDDGRMEIAFFLGANGDPLLLSFPENGIKDHFHANITRKIETNGTGSFPKLCSVIFHLHVLVIPGQW